MSHTHARTRRIAGPRGGVPARAGLVVVLTLALTLLGTSSAWAITRGTVLSRAQTWVDHPVRYSQSRYYLGYRTDCSGYVSMCWATGTSWATSSFSAVTHRIPTAQLLPGDAMLKKGYHIRLFRGWVDRSHTRYIAYEAGSSLVAVVRTHSISDDLRSGYVPVRYNLITGGAATLNVLENSSFEIWSGSWGDYGGYSEEPAWWDVDGDSGGSSSAERRTDVRHSGQDSLRLLSSGYRRSRWSEPTPSELSQTAPVEAGGLYRLSAWTMTDSDPSAVELGIEYLDAADNSLAETTTTGDRWGVNAAAFTEMSAFTTAPAGATKARVTVRLEGSGSGGDGSEVTLDDIALERQQLAVGISRSKASVRGKGKVVLSGSATPGSGAPASAIVDVQAPGGKWKRLGVAPITTSASTGTWQRSFTFKRGMRKGVYHFRSTVPGYNGYAGATSRTLSVRLR
jgi:hypothetical protein